MDHTDTLFPLLPDYTSTMFDDSSTLSMGFGASDFNVFPMSLDASFGCFDEPLNFNLFNDDHLMSDMLSDNVFMDSSMFDLPSSSLVDDNILPYLSTSPPKRAKSSKSRKTPNDSVNKTLSSNSSSISLLNGGLSSPLSKAKQAKSSPVAPKVTIGSPKVYIEQSKKKRTGTSLLVKKPKKRNSLLSKMDNAPTNNVVLPAFSLNKNNEGSVACYDTFKHDHTYCQVSKVTASLDIANVAVSNSTEMQNNLDDFGDDFIPDDVVLNELPNCLQDLLDLDMDFDLDSEDILLGLNDACNFMTDHYIEDLENYIDKDLILTDLNITEDDMIAATQSSVDNLKCENVAKEMPLLDVASPLPDFHELDNFDSSSVTTGCTEESFEDEQKRRTARAVRAKRHRSLSSSSIKRKRHFSTRSSINSSDSMSDSSSVESSSSRCSSPDRSPGPFQVPFTASNANFYRSKFTNEPKRNVNWMKKERRAVKPAMGLKGKLQVIDMSKSGLTGNKARVRRASGVVEIGSSHADDVNKKVLYIGDVADGTTKTDIRTWFSRFGTIEEVQLHFSDVRNYAFVTYKSVYETNNAIKYGNDDKNHPKFMLAYGKKDRKRPSYKDLDSCSEDNLDFRIDHPNTSFDALLRSASEFSVKLSA